MKATSSQPITLVLFSLILVCLQIVRCSEVQSPATENDYTGAWAKAPQILSRITPPTFPDRDFNVRDYGAVADGKSDSRPAIRDAVAACAEAGGGRVMIPAGTYKVNGPIHLQSNVNLHVSEGATLLFSVNPEDYLPPVLVRWEGTRCYNYSPLIYAYQQENIAVTGSGTLDGQTEKFWQLWKLIHDKDKKTLRRMGKDLVPVEERVFGKGHFLRPTLIEPYECQNILIEGVTFKGSPFWTIHPVFCTNVTVRGVTVEKGMSNDDGCNPESCKDVLIENCTFRTDDDNIAIKAGRDNDAWVENGGRPSENIIIRNNSFAETDNGAITIGSEMSGGVRNVFAQDNVMKTVGSAFYVKSNTDRGGAVEDIYYRNTTISRCLDAVVRLRLDYKGATGGNHPARFRNFAYENIRCSKALTGVRVIGLPEKQIANISLRDVTIDTVESTLETFFTDSVQVHNVTFTTILADESEYYEDAGGEEAPGRLFWTDLPQPVRRTFLNILFEIVDSKREVTEEARQEVRQEFASNPMVTQISRETRNDRVVYELAKDFGSEDIQVVIAEDGEVLVRN